MKKELLKQLRKEIFIRDLITNKSYLKKIISASTNLNIEYINKYLMINKKQKTKYDLITRIKQNQIIIKTSKENEKIKEIKEQGRFYKIKYNEETEKYIIKIDTNKIFESTYYKTQDYLVKIVETKMPSIEKKDILDFLIAVSVIKLSPIDMSKLEKNTKIKIGINYMNKDYKKI